MKKNKLFLFLAAFAVIVLLAACGSSSSSDGDAETSDEGEETGEAAEGENVSSVHETGMPIVDETIEMEIFTPKPPQHKNNDWNDILMWNTYEDLTNVDVTWNLVDWDAREEKRNLALGTGDLPDAFFGSELPLADVKKYGDQGTFIKLNDLIDQYAPNLKKILEEDPAVASAITFPDGNIYSMPSMIAPGSLSINLGARPWINKDWLEELNMEVPETTDEFYEYLKAVKELDPVGGGKTIPYGGTQVAEMVEWLSGSFGVMNAGPVNDNIDADPNDPTKVRFYAVEEGYKELLQYLNKLYEEGLIQENIFDIEWGQFMTNGEENLYGSMVFYDPITLFGNDIGGQYTSLAALKGPNGDQSYTKVSSSVFQASHFVITDQNEHPEAAVRWMDYFYSDEGTKLYYMGVEGETYEEVDGKAEYVDSLLDEEGNPVEDAILEKLTWVGVINGALDAEFFTGSEAKPQSMEATEKIEPYVPDVIWGPFTYSEEENKVLEATGQDVNKYVEEMRDKFIKGSIGFDEWDSYVDTIEQMGGLDELLAVYQAAYDRYQGN